MSVDRIISFRAWRKFPVCSMLIFFIVSTGMPMTLSLAQNRYKPEVVLPRDYPAGFDGYGRIEALDDYRAVIQDILIKLAPSVTFHTPTNMYSTAAEFKIGDMVGYLTNEAGEIISLWLIE